MMTGIGIGMIVDMKKKEDGVGEEEEGGSSYIATMTIISSLRDMKIIAKVMALLALALLQGLVVDKVSRLMMMMSLREKRRGEEKRKGGGEHIGNE